MIGIDFPAATQFYIHRFIFTYVANTYLAGGKTYQADFCTLWTGMRNLLAASTSGQDTVAS